MNQPKQPPAESKPFYQLAPLNGGYIVVKHQNGKTETISPEDTLPHALARINQLLRKDLGL